MATHQDTRRGSEPTGRTTAFTAETRNDAIELRDRREAERREPADIENPVNPPQRSPDRASRFRIAVCCMLLDLMTAHTITEDLTIEETLQNLEHHFQYLWGTRVSASLVLQWIRNEQLYNNPAIAHLPGFRDFVNGLPPEQLDDLIERTEASLFLLRAVKSRIRKLEDQNTIIGLAQRDLKHAYEVNLGLLIEERPESEGDYVRELSHKRFVECDRLAGMLAQARRLRDLATAAFRQGYLDDDLLPGLRARIDSLNENYDQARELLGERNTRPLVDRRFEDWLTITLLGPRRRRQFSPITLACLTLIFSIIAGYPAFRGLYNLPDRPGFPSDSDFWSLLSSVILQLLNLATQLIAPRIWRLLVHDRRVAAHGDEANREGDVETIAWIWLIVFLAVFFTVGSLGAYVTLSVQFSTWMAFVAQVLMGMIHLMLVYRD